MRKVKYNVSQLTKIIADFVLDKTTIFCFLK